MADSLHHALKQHHPTAPFRNIGTSLSCPSSSTMDNEKGLLTPNAGHEAPTRSVTQPLRAKRSAVRTWIAALVFNSFVALWLWFYSPRINEYYNSLMVKELGSEFEHWPLFIDDLSDSDECALTKGHHWNPHRRPRFLNGRPAEKIFLYVVKRSSFKTDDNDTLYLIE